MIKIIKRKHFKFKKIKIETFEPFDKNIINSLSNLSSLIMSSSEAKIDAELMSFGFWIRKNNLIKFKKSHSEKLINMNRGIGVLLHIPPSNIVSNFAYSLVFGIISGNINIVRLPEKSKKMAKFLISKINQVDKKSKFKIGKLIYIIENFIDNDFSNYLSSVSDGRLIWGGDKTVELFKNFSTKKNCKDIYFKDKYSLSLINSDKVINLDNFNLNLLIKNFFNDTYLVDQNACSSPNLIIWTGKNTEKAKHKFWKKLEKYINEKYKLDFFAAVDKFTSSIIYSAKNPHNSDVKNYRNLLIRIKLNKLSKDLDNFRGKWGLFYEYNNIDKFKINLPKSKKYQTLTYFGYSKSEINKLSEKSFLSSISRLVPIGLSMEMNLFWDGYDIISILTKKISY